MRLRLTFLITLFIVIAIAFFSIFTIINGRIQFGEAFITELTNENSESIDLEVPDLYFFQGDVTEEGDSKSFAVMAMRSANQRFDKVTIMLTLLFTVAASVIAYFVAGKALKPIEEFRRELRLRDIRNIDAPFGNEENSPKEIKGLQHSFTEMSERVKESYDLQKRFANNAAHELKTPLSTMKSGIQLLKMEGTDLTSEELSDSLNRIEQQVDRFTGIIEDLELLADQEMTTEFLNLPLKEFINEILEEYQETIGKKKLTIIIEEQDETIWANPSLLYYALRNLIENAIKYSDSQGAVSIYWRKEVGFLKIFIENTGKEIPESDQLNIFQAFYRVDDSRSRNTGGSGLGLSIVAKVMEKYGGEVRLVCSTKEKTIFELTLPFEKFLDKL